MIKISAIYERSKGTNFDRQYYLERHVPMAKEILRDFGLLKIEADIFESIEGVLPAKFFAVTHAFFSDDAAPEKILTNNGMKKIVADVATYTNVTPYLQISRVAEFGC